ncbi:hypothetical protein Drorol1_Dr00022210, partial [Drosera rotundifolia]
RRYRDPDLMTSEIQINTKKQHQDLAVEGCEIQNSGFQPERLKKSDGGTARLGGRGEVVGCDVVGGGMTAGGGDGQKRERAGEGRVSGGDGGRGSDTM